MTLDDFHTPWHENLETESEAVVYWKDGCSYCINLISELATDSRVIWVNVYKDRAAQPRVEGLNNGNLLTPTAIVGGERVMINPSGSELRAALDEL